MNSNEVIKNRELPADSLDNADDKFLALAIPGIGCLAFGLAWLFNWGPPKEPENFKVYAFCFFLTSLAYTFFAFRSERKIRVIVTGLGKDYNLSLVNQTLKKLKWAGKEVEDKYVKTVQINSWGMNKGYKLVIVIDNNTVYFNIRNLGSYKGRLPYAFGGNLFYALKFRNELTTAKLKTF